MLGIGQRLLDGGAVRLVQRVKDDLPLRRLWGVGPSAERELAALGARTIGDLVRLGRSRLEGRLGASGAHLWELSQGIDERPVNPNRERKSSGSETTFNRDLVEPAEIEAGVLRMADDVWSWCEKRQAFGRTVTVKVKFHDFQIITRSRTLSGLVDSEGALRDVSLGLIRSIYPVPKGIRLVGVTVSKFEARPIHEEAELPLAPA